jgi:hypothetical protein
MHEHEYLLPHKIHINCHITIMAILELLPQPPVTFYVVSTVQH